jgi:uncharacterized protein involved in tolerance to divalent cations
MEENRTISGKILPKWKQKIQLKEDISTICETKNAKWNKFYTEIENLHPRVEEFKTTRGTIFSALGTS